MRRGSEMVLLCLGGALTGACGSATSAPRAGESAFTDTRAPGSACVNFTRALCTYLMQCQHVPYCTLDHCLAESDCAGFAELGNALRAGAVAYDASKGEACLASFAANPCSLGVLPQSPDVFDVLSQCPGALTPQLRQGAACTSSAECMLGLACAGAASGCPGVCSPQRRAFPGSPCVGYSDCESGGPSLWCDLTTGACAPGVDAGAACGATAIGLTACADGLWCDAVSSGTQGECRLPGGAGAPCNDLGGCGESFHCSGYAPSGATAMLGLCAPPGDAGVACEISSDCATNLACIGGTCGGRLDVGVRCNSDDQCRPGLTCATEKCLEAKCPGDDCTDPNAACVLSLCRDGHCQPRARTGEPCVVNGDCGSGACAAGSCAPAGACIH
jgi:hypothetical protein